MNEHDVPPVMVIHQLCQEMKLGRHIKGKFKFSKQAIDLAEDESKFFQQLATHFLFHSDHSLMQRRFVTAPGNWDVFLNVINVEANHGATEAHLLKTFYVYDEHDKSREGYWDHWSFLNSHILFLLYWIGFLNQKRSTLLGGPDTMYSKSDLWRRCLRLETDRELKFQVIE